MIIHGRLSNQLKQSIHKSQLRSLIILGRIVSTGFNAALKLATGMFIVRVDGHCEIAPDYISTSIDYLTNHDVAGVGGPIETISTNQLGDTIAIAMSSSFGVGGSSFRTVKDREILVDTIAFPAYQREAMDVAGPLDEELVRNQDDEYNYRLRSLGYKLLLTPRIKSRYYSRSSLRRLWSQYFGYGLYKVRVMQKHPLQMRPRQFVPVVFVSGVIIGGILSLFFRPLRPFWGAGIALYAIANLLASVITARRTSWQHFPMLPVVFATLHISYGLGFLRGLLIFRNRWGDRG